MNDTVIVVGGTRLDEYDNLWVTPAGGGDEVKIAKKREALHPLFEQGKAVLLHWETYMDKAYVAKAEAVAGKLPPPTEPGMLKEHQEVIQKAVAETKPKPAPQELGMWWKELGEMLRAKDIDTTKPVGKQLRTVYYAQMLSVLDIKIEEEK